MASPLRIGLVLDDTLDRPDGVQQMVLLLGQWLSSQGHEVYYLVGQTTRADIDGIRSVARTWRVKFNANVLEIPLPASRKRIRKLLQALRLDVLHVQMPYSPLMAGRIIAAARNEAVVGTFHILPYGTWASVGTRLLGKAQVRTLAKFAAVTATSPAAAQFAQSHYGTHAMVIPNPVDLARFAGATPKRHKKLRVVFMGRLVERKGAQHLLNAVCELSDDLRHNIEVRLGGDGPLKAQLERFVERRGLETVVSFDGYISEGRKPMYLANADIAVFPSLAGESFGIVLLEAMAAGAGVVVGGNNPGYRSVLGGWPDCLVKSADSGAFARQLEQLLADTKLRSRLHTSQQQAVKQYDISIVGREFVKLYERCFT